MSHSGESDYYNLFMSQFIQTLAQLSAALVTSTLAVPAYSYYTRRFNVVSRENTIEKTIDNTIGDLTDDITDLDDSDDDTVELLFDVVAKYKKEGFQIEHIRRGTRKGYKAGALKYAMTITDTEFVAIFDADFIPPNWFLKKAMSQILLKTLKKKPVQF